MKEFLSNIWITAIIFIICSFLTGIMTVEDSKGCKYTTILSRINLGYVIGCELSRPRFEPYK